MKLYLPLPPSTNRIWRRGKAGNVFLDKSVQVFRKEVWVAVKQVTRKTISNPVRLKVTVHPANNRSIDLDNRAKSLLDALEHAGLFENDRQVTDLHLKKGEVYPPDGMCEVEVFVIR